MVDQSLYEFCMNFDTGYYPNFSTDIRRYLLESKTNRCITRVVRLNDKIVACMILRILPTEKLRFLAIDPDYTKYGLGYLLFNDAIKIFKNPPYFSVNQYRLPQFNQFIDYYGWDKVGITSKYQDGIVEYYINKPSDRR